MFSTDYGCFQKHLCIRKKAGIRDILHGLYGRTVQRTMKDPPLMGRSISQWHCFLRLSGGATGMFLLITANKPATSCITAYTKPLW
jgi:hypothetical protein